MVALVASRSPASSAPTCFSNTATICCCRSDNMTFLLIGVPTLDQCALFGWFGQIGQRISLVADHLPLATFFPVYVGGSEPDALDLALRVGVLALFVSAQDRYILSYDHVYFGGLYPATQ